MKDADKSQAAWDMAPVQIEVETETRITSNGSQKKLQGDVQGERGCLRKDLRERFPRGTR